MMLGFIWKLRSAYGHSRGLFALNAGRLDRAQHFLLQGIVAGERASSPLIGETYLLFSATLAKLRRRPEAIEVFWTGIGEVQQSPNYSTDDVNYLGAYFCQLLDIASDRFERFDITAVRRSLRRDFPMSLSKAYLIG